MEFTPELQLEISKYKEKGNPIAAIKLGGVDYVYIGLLREDLAAIRDAAVEESRKMIEALSEDEKKDEKVQQQIMSKIDDLEESFILSFGIVSPRMDHVKIGKLPVGVSKRLKEEIFKLSGEQEEVSEPVKL